MLNAGCVALLRGREMLSMSALQLKRTRQDHHCSDLMALLDEAAGCPALLEDAAGCTALLVDTVGCLVTPKPLYLSGRTSA